ncbi:MAG TPA: stage V sporulation protein SpoVM [Firmicutes bacterium]|nr:stage V sporulation protein SpoVM [Bacillota bacterium]HIZ19818.1 stage V sporulation protein SpoVM [Bacillota bacterium]
MKIVIVKSPKMVGGILRKIFGIKKETYIEQ